MIEGLTTLDFETEAIEGNPLLAPPRPVGLAVRRPDGFKEYITDWDHMAMAFNNALIAGPVLFHNAPFDLSVARHWFDISWPAWSRIHDTMYLLYLADPYAKTFSLKPSAERYLGIPPDEQDACKAWILANVPEAKERDWGAYLCRVPVEILGPYAKQDVEDTFLLFEELWPKTQVEPYDRERRLMPILAAATIKGVRLNQPGLQSALELTLTGLERADRLIRGRLLAPSLNLDSPAQLVEVLKATDEVAVWGRTPKGELSVDKKKIRYKDPVFANLMNYRSTARTLIKSFMLKWQELQVDGRLHPNWNSTRGDRDGGTRTGRLSSSAPNFQNIPNPAEITPIEGLPNLPHLRDYILPEEGHLWVKRDFSAQEIRIAAHFEDGLLAQAFREDPDLDPHEMVRQIVLELLAQDHPRKHIKETGFGILYGMGRPGLSQRLWINTAEADNLIRAYLQAMPGLAALQRGTKRRGYADEPIRTWGGRLIYKEPAKEIKGQMRSFEYKLLNYLIQGSAADQTKECIIKWDDTRGDSVFMATVHDEINISAPADTVEHHMEHLRTVMDYGCDFDVPMRSEGFIGPSWGEVGDE